jgi:hypothetical protein
MRRCASMGLVTLVVPVGVALAACSGAPGPGGGYVPSGRPVTAGAAAATPPSPRTPEPAPSAATLPATSTVTIGWAGDAVPASTRQGLPRDPATLLGSVADELRAPDLMLVNLEGTLGRRGLSKCVRWNVRDCHAFQAPESYGARVFAATGVDAVSVANNHAFDYGPEGQHDTRIALEEAGVAVTGGAGEVTVLERAGVRVALVAAAPYTWCEDLRDGQHLVRVVRQARERADVVVVALHLGAEGTAAAHTPSHTEWYLGENRGNPRRLAHALVDAGADLVVGSGPHVVRGIEFYRGHLVAYSLGNLVGYGGALQTSGDLALSGILDVELRGDGTFVSGRLVPLRLGRDGVPRPDPDAATVRRVRALSASDFGAAAAVVGRDGTVWPRT